jgi:hypothetical protein
MTYHRVCNKSNTTAAQQRHVEQELITLPEHLSSPSDFDGVFVSRSIAFFVVFCRSLFVCFFFSFFIFWSFYCLFFFDLPLLVTPLLITKDIIT